MKCDELLFEWILPLFLIECFILFNVIIGLMLIGEI